MNDVKTYTRARTYLGISWEEINYKIQFNGDTMLPIQCAATKYMQQTYN